MTSTAERLARWAHEYSPTTADRALARRALVDTLAVTYAARDSRMRTLAAGLPDAARWAAIGHVLDFADRRGTGREARRLRPDIHSGLGGRADPPDQGAVMTPLVPTSRSNQAPVSPTAPQGNVTQASHKHVTKQNLSSPNATPTFNSGEAEQS